MIITVLSKGFGFLREMALSYFFGATEISDAFLISTTIPSVIFAFIAAGVTTAYIPIQTKILNDSSEIEADLFTNYVTNFYLIIAAAIVTLVLVFTEPIVRLFAYGFTVESLDITVNFTRITIFSVFFTLLVAVLSGYLQVNKNFTIPASAWIISHVVITISFYFAKKTTIHVMSYGFLVGLAAQFIWLVPSLVRQKFKYEPVLDFRDKNLQAMIILSLPVIIGTQINQINLLIDRTIASSLAVGAVSSLNYSSKLSQIAYGLIALPLVTVIYPTLSTYAVKKDFVNLKNTLNEAMNTVSLFLIPCTIVFMIFSNEIISLLFEHGVFDKEAVSMTAGTFYFYAIGLIGFGLRDVVARVFYSMGDTKTPTINGLIGVLINIVLIITLSRLMGINGIALATSLSALFTTFLLIISLRKKIGEFGLRNFFNTSIKVIVASCIMASLSLIINNFLLHLYNNNLFLIISVSIAALGYCVIIYFMKIKEVDNFVCALKVIFS